jgi:hypothetical protein
MTDDHEPASLEDCMKAVDMMLNGGGSGPSKMAFVIIALPFSHANVEMEVPISVAGNIPPDEVVRLIKHMASRDPIVEH